MQEQKRERSDSSIQLIHFLLILHSSIIVLWLKMKSGNKDRIGNTHRYILWRRVIEHDEGPCNVDAMVISMGEHGSLHSQSANVQSDPPKKIKSESPLDILAAHNIAEIRRATEEAEKWETRLNDSPLGKTQQDFVAYYTGVIVLFKEWCASNDVQFPD
jgi:hypothetical protein